MENSAKISNKFMETYCRLVKECGDPRDCKYKECVYLSAGFFDTNSLGRISEEAAFMIPRVREEQLPGKRKQITPKPFSFISLLLGSHFPWVSLFSHILQVEEQKAFCSGLFFQ